MQLLLSLVYILRTTSLSFLSDLPKIVRWLMEKLEFKSFDSRFGYLTNLYFKTIRDKAFSDPPTRHDALLYIKKIPRLGICLPMQATEVWGLVREDPTCHRATKPVHHNYWACPLEPASHNYWAHVPRLLKPTRLEPMLRNKRSHRNEKPAHLN